MLRPTRNARQRSWRLRPSQPRNSAPKPRCTPLVTMCSAPQEQPHVARQIQKDEGARHDSFPCSQISRTRPAIVRRGGDGVTEDQLSRAYRDLGRTVPISTWPPFQSPRPTRGRNSSKSTKFQPSQSPTLALNRTIWLSTCGLPASTFRLPPHRHHVEREECPE
jgi:hypothetical protein